MTSIYNKIHRLKRQSGWTWDRFLSEIDKVSPTGVNEKTLYSHYRQPHIKTSAHISKLIDHLHDLYFPNPFPEEINRLMRLYDSLIGSKIHPTKDKDIENLEFFLIDQLSRDAESEHLRIARLNWLLGNIQFDRIPNHRDNGRRQQLKICQQQAINYYQNSVRAIEQHNQGSPQSQVGASHLYKARHNILACYLNAVPEQQRNQDSTLLRYLKESDYIANSKQTLLEEPFQWSICRDGLRFSSLVENIDDVKHFFETLVTASECFLDLDYQPLNYSPISAGIDFKWAIKNVLTPEYLASYSRGSNKNKRQARI